MIKKGEYPQINSYYSALIEMWVNGEDWDALIEQVEMGEGDIVRTFKRVIDVLRQLCTVDNVPEAVVFTAREAIEKILSQVFLATESFYEYCYFDVAIIIIYWRYCYVNQR